MTLEREVVFVTVVTNSNGSRSHDLLRVRWVDVLYGYSALNGTKSKSGWLILLVSEDGHTTMLTSHHIRKNYTIIVTLT